MSKILIANLGYRSLIKKDAEGNLREYDTRKTYREDTETDFSKLEKGDEVITSFAPNIIPSVIEKEPSISQIYLLSSDQTGATKSFTIQQDTLYAGEILAKYYNHFNIPTQNKTINTSVIDLEKLTIEYRKILYDLIFIQHPQSEFIICDSGGTPQQKTVLKIVTEYYLPQERVKYYQAYEIIDNKNEIILGQSRAEAQEFYQISRIADEQNIALLIEQGEYAAAAKIRGKRNPSNDFIKKLLWLLNYRFLFMEKEAIKQVTATEYDDIKPAVFEEAIKHYLRNNEYVSESFPTIHQFMLRNPTGVYTKWEDDLLKNDFLKLTEILEVACFYWHKRDNKNEKDWRNIVLIYHVFLEGFLKGIIIKLGKNPMDSAFRSIPDKVNYIEDNYSKLSKKVHSIVKDIKALQRYFIIKSNPNTSKKGLDQLRNMAAHDGKGIKEADVLQYTDNFDQTIERWHEAFGVPFTKEDNAYYKANKEILDYLKIPTK